MRLSTRLAAWYGLTLFVLLGLFAATVYVGFRQGLYRDFDRHLVHERRMLMPFVDAEPVRFVGLEGLRAVALQTDGTHGTFVRLFDADGREVYRSPNFAARPDLPAARLDDEVTRASRPWGGAPARTLATPLRAGAAEVGEGAIGEAFESGPVVGWIEVTGLMTNLDAELRRLAQGLALGIVLSLVLAMAAGFWLARRALRPVAALTDAANRIRATDLSARLPAEFGVRDELTDLAETFNAMLDRLEGAVRRERRFTADAAHELMTPLAALRSEAEVALRRARSPEAYRAALEAALSDAERMTDSVRGLLALARTDRLADDARAPTDWAEVAHAHAARFRARAEDAGLALTVAADAPAVVHGDPRRLGEIVDNLLDNAVKYTPEGGHVRLALAAEADRAALTVSDTGIGFDAATADRLFDRFFRADTPEAQARPGTGLGLAIVRAVAEAYGGSVEARSDGPGRGSTFTVRLPLYEKRRTRASV